VPEWGFLPQSKNQTEGFPSNIVKRKGSLYKEYRLTVEVATMANMGYYYCYGKYSGKLGYAVARLIVIGK